MFSSHSVRKNWEMPFLTCDMLSIIKVPEIVTPLSSTRRIVPIGFGARSVLQPVLIIAIIWAMSSDCLSMCPVNDEVSFRSGCAIGGPEK